MKFSTVVFTVGPEPLRNDVQVQKPFLTDFQIMETRDQSRLRPSACSSLAESPRIRMIGASLKECTSGADSSEKSLLDLKAVSLIMCRRLP